MASTPAARSQGAGTDPFGCSTSRLQDDQTLSGADIRFHRKTARGGKLDRVETPGSDRGMLIGLAASGGHRRTIFHAHHATHHAFERGALYIRDMAEPYRADLTTPFDFFLMEISPAGLERISGEADLGGRARLAPQTATPDPVLSHLLQALIPAFERPEEAGPLFVDQMAVVIGTHLVHRHGGRPAAPEPRAGKLTPAQESRAKSILLDHLAGEVSVAQVASACGLSRGHFITAFRRTTGQTPHRWLQAQRIRRACDMMRATPAPLAEVAIACGFADQSHFTRVFTASIGAAPGAWRRAI